MLFIIDEEISASVANGTCSLATCEALDFLGLAMFEGKHRVTASQSGLIRLSRYNAMSLKARAAFAEALNEFQADQALLKKLTVHVRITTTVSVVTVATVAGGKRIDVPPSWIDDSAKIQATCLVGENLIDCDFLQRVGSVARAVGSVGNCVLKFEFINGGGSTCAPVIEELTARPRFCCCVVDSDKKCPAGGLGGTASAVQKFKDPALYPYVGIIETYGRELENMVHRHFIEHQYLPDVSHGAAIKILKHADDSSDLDLRYFYDVKEGLVLADIYKHAVGSPQRTFWENKLTLLGPLLKHSHPIIKCTETVTCVDDGCSCRITNGFGKKVLHAFIAYADQRGAKKVGEEIPPSILEEWKRVGQFLMDWGCARDRVRV